MIRMISFRLAGGLLLALFCTGNALAQSVWVSDVFEVTLRTGPSTSNAIQLMVESGTELQVLTEDDGSGYTEVRTGGGTEGWVLSRYLMQEPSAREQLGTLTQQLTSVAAEGSSMESQLGAIRGQYAEATQQIAALERDKANLESELEDIKRTAANTLAIDSQNKSLQQELTNTEIQFNSLQEENERLQSQTTRNWFITGSLVLFGGILLGLLLPRLKFQKKRRYDSFINRLKKDHSFSPARNIQVSTTVSGLSDMLSMPLVDQPAGQVRMIGGTLTTNSNIFVVFRTSTNGHR